MRFADDLLPENGKKAAKLGSREERIVPGDMAVDTTG